MSLERFVNKEKILSELKIQYGQLFTDTDLSILDDVVLIPHDQNLVNNQRSELHVYSFYGDYLIGNHDAKYSFLEPVSNSLLVDIRSTFAEANINRGSYIVSINFFQNAWGDFDNKKVFVKEISPDRTELKVSVDKKVLDEYPHFKTYIQSLTDSNVLNNLVINFGFNRIQKIVNVWFDEEENGTFYLKLYQPLFDDIEDKSQAWFDFEVIDPYLDTVILVNPTVTGKVNQLRGPNFDIDTALYSSNSTTYKSWDDLLDANLSTSQRIIDQSLSGSGVVLNVDYTSFENFVFYSSAEERLRNFHYKVSKIEEYSSSIAVLLNSTASNTIFISGAIDLNRRRIDQISTQFTPFERWSYYEPTSSLFSHDRSGSITPWPKRLISGSWVNWSISSSITDTWYQTLLTSSSKYDEQNTNRLYWSIPEHVYMDAGSSDYVLFVEMIGEHFDLLYAYINAMPQIHEKEEHPKRGVSNGLLSSIASSFGWELQNTRQLADLWKYKLGTNNQGQYAATGSMFSLSHEDQTHMIWRRIVNNLPYLLKTKGTSRSIKALMSIYGIPQTLIGIKEYGGPSPVTDRPTLIEDRYYYRAIFTGSNWVELNRGVIPVSSGSWGSTVYGTQSGSRRVPDTIEFNFATTYTSSVSMSMWAIEDGTNRSRVTANLQLIHKKHIDGTSSYSGSNDYGKLKLSVVAWRETVNEPKLIETSTSEYLPFFDGDPWSVQLTTNYPFSQSNITTQTITVSASRASDCLLGRVNMTSSFGITVVGSASSVGRFTYSWGAGSGSQTTPHIIMLGGTTGSMSGSLFTINSSSRFIGNIYGYKEYFEKIGGTAFNSHTLNPSAYHGNTETSSFYTLYRYYPLGLDCQRYDHSIYQSVSSSQPNRRASFATTASFKNWQGSQSYQYESINETFYVYTPSLGGNSLRSEKIRLEDSVLARDLSPVSRAEKSAFDKAGFDSNRLAIVFAPNDHVNNEIYNHTGYAELDSWIGDPQYQFEEGYSELQRFRHEYFQKYAKNNDVNTLIRLLALYDYTFFEQIKQLVPGRADLIAGILIEDPVLHRNKVVIAKRPTIENPQWEKIIPSYVPTSSGEYLNLEASSSIGITVQSRYSYITGSIPDPVAVVSRYSYITGSVSDPARVTGSIWSHFNTNSSSSLCGLLDIVPNEYSGSQSVTQSYYHVPTTNCCYKKVNYHYSSSGQYGSKYLKQWYTAVSMSYGMYYSRSLDCGNYQNNECFVSNNHRFRGSKLSAPDFNVNTTDTIDGGPVVTVWNTTPERLQVGDNVVEGNLIVK